jgi:DNA adenine methylase
MAALQALAVPGRVAKRQPTWAKPFVKWAGGKTQLLGELLKRFPKNVRRYHEPFLGGGAVFFSTQPTRAYLSDVNAELIATYQAIRDHVEEVIEALQAHEVNEAYYYAVRAQDSDTLDPIQCAARTLFLNRTCYNGLYRVNRSGQFNVPYGHYANPTLCNAANLRLASRALKKVTLVEQSVFAMSRRVRRGDLVYFDPPYDPVSPSASFTAYAKQGFGRPEQESLRDLFLRLAQRGVHVVLSNSDTPFIRQLYRGCRIDRVQARRAINSRADRRGTVGEVIVTCR